MNQLIRWTKFCSYRLLEPMSSHLALWHNDLNGSCLSLSLQYHFLIDKKSFFLLYLVSFYYTFLETVNHCVERCRLNFTGHPSTLISILCSLGSVNKKSNTPLIIVNIPRSSTVPLQAPLDASCIPRHPLYRTVRRSDQQLLEPLAHLLCLSWQQGHSWCRSRWTLLINMPWCCSCLGSSPGFCRMTTWLRLRRLVLNLAAADSGRRPTYLPSSCVSPIVLLPALLSKYRRCWFGPLCWIGR
jgi:hypothetical protein